MKASKKKKKMRWLEKDMHNPKRAKIIRSMSAAKLERLRHRP